MDISMLSTAISQANLSERLGFAVLKMAMDSVQAEKEGLVKILEETTKAMELSVRPHLGGNLDIYA